MGWRNGGRGGSNLWAGGDHSGRHKFKPSAVPVLVGLYITAAYWFTASTSFANPAVTISRAFTNTFSGITPEHAPAFIMAQLVGAALAVALFGWLLRPSQVPVQ